MPSANRAPRVARVRVYLSSAGASTPSPAAHPRRASGPVNGCIFPDAVAPTTRVDRLAELDPRNGRCLPAEAASLRRVWVSNCGALHPMGESEVCRIACGSPPEKEPATRSPALQGTPAILVGGVSTAVFSLT